MSSFRRAMHCKEKGTNVHVLSSRFKGDTCVHQRIPCRQNFHKGNIFLPPIQVSAHHFKQIEELGKERAYLCVFGRWLMSSYHLSLSILGIQTKKTDQNK